MGFVPSDDELAAVVDHLAVSRLQTAYADGVTRRDWDAVSALFLADAAVSLDLVTRPGIELRGPEALVGFVAEAIERFSFFEFVILNSHIDLWPGGERSAATARVFMCELRHDRGTLQRSEAFGLYSDTYAKGDRGWRIAARSYRSMARYPDGEVFPLS